MESKGRITIPKSVRERSDLTAGDHVDIDVEGVLSYSGLVFHGNSYSDLKV
ncbi:AbrB/MazE/SpoVT family DNA-binding domain-containing protein [Halocatena pleomorpha]|uniref:AbrB/MazE/SpoVT family DNA-binding domain-containing protein n=1 Tax=Halocatena pleomorpha TaxID=1785090 RepID=A0A3P3RBE2_9EURY|nr:AbrB/MazE/SpoVT family DNA-binding domain-containing protein [Halocatena pleomorpha]